MLVWVVLTVMAAVAAVALAIPLVRRHDAPPGERAAVLGVLRGELAELDRQTAAGALSADEGAALRVELQRRLLAESRGAEPPARPLEPGGRSRLAFGAAGLVALVAAGLYAYLGRPDLAGGAAAPAPPAVAAAPAANPAAGEVGALIAQLEARMAATPDDPEGWRMLGWSYFSTARYADAARAYARALALDPRGEGYASALGEAQVAAAQGVVTPAARASFARAAELDAGDARARYFLALAKDQAGDRRAALDEWITLYREAAPDAPYRAELRRVIDQAAAAQGIDVAARLGAPAAAPAPGPTAADVAAAQAMPQADRQAMIRGMVDNLAARLAADPNDAAGWERLIRARMVLGDRAAAAKALADAERAFANDPATRTRLQATAREQGVPGA